MNIRDMHKKDIISGVFLLFMALFVIFVSFGMSIWKNEDPNEGFFPLILGILLCSLSISLLLKTVKSSIVKGVQGAGASDEKIGLINGVKSEIIKIAEDADADDEMINLPRVYEYLVASFSYAILFETLGYILTTTLFFMAIIKFVERKGYLFSLLITLAVISSSFLLFDTLLRVPLPLGILEWLRR